MGLIEWQKDRPRKKKNKRMAKRQELAHVALGGKVYIRTPIRKQRRRMRTDEYLCVDKSRRINYMGPICPPHE